MLQLTSDASLRGMTSPDGLQVFSVYDFITLACQKTDGGAYARKTYSNIMKDGCIQGQTKSNYGRMTYGRLISDGSEFRNGILKHVQNLHFPGGRGAATPTMTIEGLSKLMTVLGNKVSKAFRLEAFDVLERYLDGDMSMCTEIEENKAMGRTASHQQFVNKVLKRTEEMQETNEMPAVTYVYATKSAAFPGLIKIGRSVNVNARLSSLNTSCAPAPHKVVVVSPSFDSVRDEKVAHQFFAGKRKEGEFFEVSESDVKSYFSAHITTQFNMEMAELLVQMQT